MRRASQLRFRRRFKLPGVYKQNPGGVHRHAPFCMKYTCIQMRCRIATLLAKCNFCKRPFRTLIRLYKAGSSPRYLPHNQLPPHKQLNPLWRTRSRPRRVVATPARFQHQGIFSHHCIPLSPVVLFTLEGYNGDAFFFSFPRPCD